MKARYKTSKKQNRKFGKTVNRTHQFNVNKPKYVMRGGTRL
jgi:hypothetical protein